MKQQIRGHIQHLNWAPNAERQKLKSASSRGRPDFAGLWGRNKMTAQRHMPKTRRGRKSEPRLGR